MKSVKSIVCFWSVTVVSHNSEPTHSALDYINLAEFSAQRKSGNLTPDSTPLCSYSWGGRSTEYFVDDEPKVRALFYRYARALKRERI